MAPLRLAMAIGAVTLLWACPPVRTAHPQTATTQWRTGPAQLKALAAPVNLFFTDSPVRDAFQTIARRTRVAVVLDRRIDPTVLLTVDLHEIRLRDALEQLAWKVQASVTQIGPVMYVGPFDATMRLDDTADRRRRDAQQLSGEMRKHLMKVETIGWPRLSVPGDLIERMAGQLDFELVNQAPVDHDLWPALELPPMTWVDRMTVLLAGFQLTFDIDVMRRQVRTRPIPDVGPVDRPYFVTLERARVERLQDAFPTVVVRQASGHVRFRGKAEDHRRLMQWLQRNASTGTAPLFRNDIQYTLKFANQPLGALLKTLKQKAGLRVEVPASLAARLNTPISIQVNDVSLDQLLQRAFLDTGLRFERKGGVIRVMAAESP